MSPSGGIGSANRIDLPQNFGGIHAVRLRLGDESERPFRHQ